MEYLPEGDLYRKLFEGNEEVEINEDTICVIMKQLLSAICYIHSKGILHGDIKPENILVETFSSLKSNLSKSIKSYTDHEEISIKLCDFGTCNRFLPNEKYQERIGSPFYIAPEVLKKEYNEKCDVWSCGIVMYFLLTGEMPFEGKNDIEVRKNIVKGHIDFDNENLEDISKEAKSLLIKLLTYDYKNRISAEEALKVQWFHQTDEYRQSLFENSFSKTMIKRVKKFNAKEKLQQATLAFITHYLDSNEEIEKLKRIFHQINQKNDGKISHNELKEGLLRIKGQLITENEIFNIFQKIDQDNNGYIDYEEFLRASVDYSLLLTETNLKIAFNNFDKNKDGKLDRDEVRFIFQSDNNNYFDELIKKIDYDKDGEINFKEYSGLMNALVQELKSNKSSVKSNFVFNLANKAK